MDSRDDNDEPSASFGPFTAEEIVERLGHMARIWQTALAVMQALRQESRATPPATSCAWPVASASA